MIAVTLVGLAGMGRAQRPPAAPPGASRAPVAVFRVEPLGLDEARAARLEALFRLELERLVRTSLPSKPSVEKIVAQDPSGNENRKTLQAFVETY